MQIVLLHGWGFDASIWTVLIEKLNSLDQVATIKAIKVHDWNDSRSISSNIHCPTIIVGWSLGAHLAIDIAIENSHIKGLLLINYNPCFIRRDDWPGGIDRNRLVQMREDLLHDAEQCIHKFYTWCCYGNKESLRWMRNHTFNDLQKQDEESLLCGLDRLLNDDQRSVLKNLKCPVEMLFSGHDVLVAAEIENDCNELNNTIHTGHIASASHLSPLLDTLDIVNALGHIYKQFQCTQ